MVSYNANTYHIYSSTEKISCFLCRKEGHIAKHCPTSAENNESLELDMQTQEQEKESDSLSPATLNNTTQIPDNISPFKAPGPVNNISSIETSKREHSNFSASFTKSPKKKCIEKKEEAKPPENLTELVQTFKEKIKTHDISQLPLAYLSEFREEEVGSTLKTRLTKLIKQLGQIPVTGAEMYSSSVSESE